MCVDAGTEPPHSLGEPTTAIESQSCDRPRIVVEVVNDPL